MLLVLILGGALRPFRSHRKLIMSTDIHSLVFALRNVPISIDKEDPAYPGKTRPCDRYRALLAQEVHEHSSS